MGQIVTHTVTTNSLCWQIFSVDIKLPYFDVVIPLATLFLWIFSFPLLNPFMFASFKEDDASKEPWHIKRFHMLKADFWGEI